MDKTIADVDRIITLRLKALKKEYYFKYGDAAPLCICVMCALCGIFLSDRKHFLIITGIGFILIILINVFSELMETKK